MYFSNDDALDKVGTKIQAFCKVLEGRLLDIRNGFGKAYLRDRGGPSVIDPKRNNFRLCTVKNDPYCACRFIYCPE